MVRKRFLFFLVLLSILILPSVVLAAVLWDQPMSSVNRKAYFSMGFDPSDPSDSFIADEFVTTKTWNISTIFIPGDFWFEGIDTSLMNASALQWRIYADDGGKPAGYPGVGGFLWWLELTPDDPQVTISAGWSGFLSDVAVNLTEPLQLFPGTYWLVFNPKLDFNFAGGWGRQPSDTTNGYVAQFIEPGGGDPPLPTVWTSVQDIDWTEFYLPNIVAPLQDFAFTLQGTALDPNIAVDKTTIDFGEELVGLTSGGQTVTISNTGTTDLHITSITITGGSAGIFYVASGATNGCTLTNQTLAPDGSCTVSVTFSPSASGAQSATLAIASDDPDTAAAEVALSGTGVQEVVPSVTEGTVGTEITFTADPSVSFGGKKGKVLIQRNKVKSVAKIAKGGWLRNTITCTVNKALPAGTYDVKIMLQPYKDGVSIDIPGGFTYKKPEIELPLADSEGAKGDLVTLTGNFFGNKKPKVYLAYKNAKGVDKKKNCPVTKVNSWDGTTGASSITFKVPGGLVAGAYPLYVERPRVGTSEEVVDFTIITTPTK